MPSATSTVELDISEFNPLGTADFHTQRAVLSEPQYALANDTTDRRVYLGVF